MENLIYITEKWKLWRFPRRMDQWCRMLVLILLWFDTNNFETEDLPRCQNSMLNNSSPLLHWRHNGCDCVPNHQPYDCLLNRLFRRRSKKISKLRVTGLCEGNSPGTGNSPHKWPVTPKMFPFYDVIMPRTNWMPFHGRHFEMHFGEWKFMYYDLIQIVPTFVPKGPFDNNSILVQVIAWRRTSDKPLSECWPSSMTHLYAALGGDVLMHCVPVTPHDVTELCHHWFRPHSLWRRCSGVWLKICIIQIVKPFWPGSIVLNRRQCDYLFNSLFSLIVTVH